MGIISSLDLYILKKIYSDRIFANKCHGWVFFQEWGGVILSIFSCMMFESFTKIYSWRDRWAKFLELETCGIQAGKFPLCLVYFLYMGKLWFHKLAFHIIVNFFSFWLPSKLLIGCVWPPSWNSCLSFQTKTLLQWENWISVLTSFTKINSIWIKYLHVKD